MRRQVLLQAVQRIIDDLNETGMSEMFRRGIELYQNTSGADRTKIDWISLSAITSFVSRVNAYSDEERFILHTMDLDALGSADEWQPHLREYDAAFLFNGNNRIRATLGFLPKILRLLQRDYDEKSTERAPQDDTEVQRVILADHDNTLSSPRRLIELLTSIQQIYHVIAEANGVPSDTIAVVGLDSGSEQSFDFLGVGKLIRELREALETAYNVVAFHRQNVTLKNLQVASETLAIVGKISKLEADQAISSDEAVRMRHGLFQGLERFANTGAYTPEMTSQRIAPAIAMRPQPALLTGPVQSIVQDANTPIQHASTEPHAEAVQDDDFSDDEVRRALALLRQSRQAESEVPPSKKRRAKSSSPRTRRALASPPSTSADE